MTPREILHAGISRSAAAQGMVLLKNEAEALPLKGSEDQPLKIAVFGIGQIMTVKGGTGSGEVNNRYNVNILDGLRAAGTLCVDETLAPLYEKWAQDHPVSRSFFQKDTGPAPELPMEMLDLSRLSRSNEAAIVVISRIAGEGADWEGKKEDYYLTDAELDMVEKVSAAFSRTVLLLNTSGVMDTSFITDAVDAVLYTSLPGQEGGNAVADVLTGAVNPSGRLSDSWPIAYADCPSAESFGIAERNGNMQRHGFRRQTLVEQARVRYTEGIMVGYRYYDSFDVPVAYPFGFGLSYTRFETRNASFTLDGDQVTVTAEVANIGDVTGRQVLQLYVAQPEGRVPKAKKVLAAFAKTADIAPGLSQLLTLSFSMKDVASFDEETACRVLEAGAYGLYLGSDVNTVDLIGAVTLDREVTVEVLRNLFAGGSAEKPLPLVPKSLPAVETDHCIALDPASITARAVSYEPEHHTFPAVDDATLDRVRKGEITLEQLVGSLTDDELTELVTGVGMYMKMPPIPPEGLKKQDEETPPGEFDIVSLGFSSRPLFVRGSAGESATNTLRGLRPISLCDGPAGVRIDREVRDEETDELLYEQNCTAWPVGTLLASTWDMDLIEEVGCRVGDEMREYCVDLWLAPGMNIHRNPLCGRNFEYYSEDPLLTGKCAAAISRGVQSRGVGVTIKHFAGNNQEDMRNCSEDIIAEQALREIYLRGFEIAVKEARPLSLMTSYNDINGVPAADNFDLCTQVLRREWGFDGFVMTDWGGGISTPALSMGAGNDMIQPGGAGMLKMLRDHFSAGEPVVSRGTARVTRTLTRYDLQLCCYHILSVLLRLPESYER